MRLNRAKWRWKLARIGALVALVGVSQWMMSPAARSQEQVKEADRYLRFDEKTGIKYQPDERGDIRVLVVPIPAYRAAHAGYVTHVTVTP